MKEYYLIRQVLNEKFKQSFKIGTPLNISHLKQIIELIPGKIFVYLVNMEDNSNQNLTKALGRTEFDFNEFRKQRSSIFKYRYSLKVGRGSFVGDDIGFYGIGDESLKFPEKVYCYGHVAFPQHSCSSIDLDYIDSLAEKHVYRGSEYEKFIGAKYEKEGYIIEYAGIDKGKQDGGIDLIAYRENKIILVQCKNWIEIDNHQITDKDLRAFIGDCYIYILKNEIKNKSISFHYIVSDDEIFSKSARYFSEKNKLIKIKTVRFDS